MANAPPTVDIDGPQCDEDVSCTPSDTLTSVPKDLSTFFLDGKRSIDFILVWKQHDNDRVEGSRCHNRLIFEQNLIAEDLELEKESIESINFVKVHAPIKVLLRYAEYLKLRTPIKGNGTSKLSVWTEIIRKLQSYFKKITEIFAIDEKYFPKRSSNRLYEDTYFREDLNSYMIDIHHSDFFTPAIRSQIVRFIFNRIRFSNDSCDKYAFGIDRLINKEVYIAAYPLHDGDVTTPGNMRHLLYTQWGSVWKFYRQQPLDYIKDYFGVKIGLYFAWLGFYTYMLIFASIVGIVCFLYGVLTVDSDIPSNEICSNKFNAKMCPLCDNLCGYWLLSESCDRAKITYLIDNPATIYFATFMSLWSALFLKLWKRYSAKITHRWDLTKFDLNKESLRPQYLAHKAYLNEIGENSTLDEEEPKISVWQKCRARLFSYSIVLLFVILAFATVLGIVLYRMSILAVISVSDFQITTTSAKYAITFSAAVINWFLIFILNWFYSWLAHRLTEGEWIRNQTEFDDSLALKIYLLQFVNSYSSIFYIAFFKGKFIGYPGEYNRLFNQRQEECGLTGCFTDLCIQLATIMIANQIVYAVRDIKQPHFYTFYKEYFLSTGTTLSDNRRWVRDFKLLEWESRHLLNEYLKPVMQYGIVTIFAAAFPLAPVFALVNNIFEVRFDAKKLLTFYRRPVIQRVQNIGVWYRILSYVAKLSIITNGFIIAFTSDFIPRMVYQFSHDGSLHGYVNHTLSYFNTSHFESNGHSRRSMKEDEVCRYHDYRSAPGTENAYEYTVNHWMILAARLAFVLLFENFIGVVMALVERIPSKNDDASKQQFIEIRNRIKSGESQEHIDSTQLVRSGPSMIQPLTEVEEQSEGNEPSILTAWRTDDDSLDHVLNWIDLLTQPQGPIPRSIFFYPVFIHYPNDRLRLLSPLNVKEFISKVVRPDLSDSEEFLTRVITKKSDDSDDYAVKPIEFVSDSESCMPRDSEFNKFRKFSLNDFDDQSMAPIDWIILWSVLKTEISEIKCCNCDPFDDVELAVPNGSTESLSTETSSENDLAALGSKSPSAILNENSLYSRFRCIVFSMKSLLLVKTILTITALVIVCLKIYVF